jgi:hypothetical protein
MHKSVLATNGTCGDMHRYTDVERRAVAMVYRAVLGLICSASIPVWAQWVHYPTPGIPRAKDGTPYLNAPARGMTTLTALRYPVLSRRRSGLTPIRVCMWRRGMKKLFVGSPAGASQ